MSLNKIFLILLLISISALLIIPGFLRARSPSPCTQCPSNCKNIGIALKMYADDNHGCYPDKLEQITPKYLRQIPTCASAGTSTVYISSYTKSANPDAYTFYCKGNNHEAIGVKPDNPMFTSREGLKIIR
ncbi:MAG: hypothetical protein LWY06_10155 [Firmicutes bacterium]|nr:hypothetical protein [Bacillota bacterium]